MTVSGAHLEVVRVSSTSTSSWNPSIGTTLRYREYMATKASGGTFRSKEAAEVTFLDLIATSGERELVRPDVDLHEEEKRLAYLATLPAGWDSYDADAVSHNALAKASRVIARLANQTGAHPYAIRPLAGGGVQIVWKGEKSEIEVDVSPNEALGYLLVKNPDGESTYDEKDDAPIDEISCAVLGVVK